MKKLAVILLSLATAFTAVPSAQAFPGAGSRTTTVSDNTDIVKVRSPFLKRNSRHWGGGRHWSGGRGYYRHGGYYGQRRYYGNRRYYRDRHYGGAIIGGLAAGAIIGGLAAQPRYYDRPAYYGGRRYVGGNDHISYCYARYRSYRASDNTYQPYSGPRRQCR